MSNSSDHRPIDPGPWREYPPPELRAVDAMLAQQARRLGVPPGLAQRVFDASVALLASPRRRQQRSLRLEPVGRISLWGRLAMAASIALAFIVAGQFLRPRPLLSAEGALVLLGDLGETQDELQGLLYGFERPPLGEIENLLLTRDMTFGDLADDLAMLAADLEM